jgi:hypothetical protein
LNSKNERPPVRRGPFGSQSGSQLSPEQSADPARDVVSDRRGCAPNRQVMTVFEPSWSRSQRLGAQHLGYGLAAFARIALAAAAVWLGTCGRSQGQSRRCWPCPSWSGSAWSRTASRSRPTRTPARWRWSEPSSSNSITPRDVSPRGRIGHYERTS